MKKRKALLKSLRVGPEYGIAGFKDFIRYMRPKRIVGTIGEQKLVAVRKKKRK